MHVKPFPTLSRLSLVLGLALSSLGVAQAAEIASASASLSGLRYRLIDLDLNDGITPTLSVGGNLIATGFTSVKDEFDQVLPNPLDTERSLSAPWFSGGTLSFASNVPGANATLGSTLTTSTRVTSEALLANTLTRIDTQTYESIGYDPLRNDGILRTTSNTYTYTSDFISLQQDATVTRALPQETVTDEFGNTSSYDLPNLTLSANTLLVLEGTLSVSSRADSEAFASFFNSTFASQPGASSPYGSGSIGAIAGLRIDPTTTSGFLPGGSVFDQNPGVYQSLSNNLIYDFNQVSQNFGPVLGPQGDSTDSQIVALTFANVGNTEMQAYLDLFVQASTYLTAERSVSNTQTTYGDPVPDTPVLPPIPGIPEPSTYALMGLGLVGIVMARRRQRA